MKERCKILIENEPPPIYYTKNARFSFHAIELGTWEWLALCFQ
jgi:hypothetical protein